MPSSRLIWPLAGIATLAGILGIGAIWTVVVVASGQPAGWMAVVAAIDAVLMLRLAGTPAGRLRATFAVIATLLTAILAHWFIVATQLGRVMGLPPLLSAFKLGPDLATQLILQTTSPVDALWLAAAVVVAIWWGR